MNEYSGYQLRKQGEAIDRIKCSDLNAERLFKDYISKRKPVVIEGLPDELEQLKHWTNEHLRNVAGHTKVKVEKRASVNDSFGQGKTVEKTFAEVLDLLDKKSNQYYLTTQEIKHDSNGRHIIVSDPLKPLLDAREFPLQPNLLGNLIPATVNIWMGHAPNGSSTGLHHDYHDNLYVLLRGKKRFRLLSPNDTEKLYTVGKVMKVHPNGRINYEGFPTRADGAELNADQALALLEKRQAAERDLELAEKAVEEGKPGAAKLVEAAETKLDEILEQVLSQKHGNKGNNNEEDDDDDGDWDIAGLRDDYEEDDDDFAAANDDDDDRPIKKRKTQETAGVDDEKSKDPTQVPLNFSSVDDVDNANKKKFPLYHKAISTFVEVHANEMLYLPAGWFHEVTSYSDDSDTGHCAFNYWMHPPDSTSFKTPYKHEFWGKDFVRGRG